MKFAGGDRKAYEKCAPVFATFSRTVAYMGPSGSGQVTKLLNNAMTMSNLDNAVDLILCDINMPVMDGLEFVKQIAGVENAKGVPVVMITTEGSESHVVQALSAGARGYIRKPFTPDQVKEHVLPLLGKKS